MERVHVAPPVDASGVGFLAGFSRHAVPRHGSEASSVTGPGVVTRTWPGQPAVPSPWVLCAQGCCLVLVGAAAGRGAAAGQWLRFLLAEFLGGHHLTGVLEVPGPVGGTRILLIVEGDDVFEGEVR